MNRRQSSSGDPFEELLDGRAQDDSALARLLTAARAPGTRDEMAALPAARTAFLDARQPRRAGPIRLPAATRTAAGRLFALKAVAAVSGATLVGGVAYAATDTNLLGGTDHRKHGPVASAPAEPRSGSTTRAVGPAPAGHSSPAAHPASTGHSGGLSSSAHSAHPPRRGAPQPAHPPKPTHPAHPPTPAHPPKPTSPAHPSRTKKATPDPTAGNVRSHRPGHQSTDGDQP